MTTPTRTELVRSDTEHDLLAAVRDVPEDDGPRLKFADWVEEFGGPDGRGDYERAEFIRVQCAIANLGDDDPWPLRRQLELRESNLAKSLLGFNEGLDLWEYAPKIPENTTCGGWVEYRRGFPDHVTLTAERLVGEACGRCEGGSLVTMRANIPIREGQFVTLNDGDIVKCLECSGTGRTAGLARRLSEWPLTGVTVSNRRPFSNLKVNGDMEYGFESHQDGADGTGMIPQEIFQFLTGHDRQPNQFRKWWNDRDAALKAFHTAALAYVRGMSPRSGPAERRPGAYNRNGTEIERSKRK